MDIGEEALGKLRTFALFKLPKLLWGTRLKMNIIIYLKFLIGVFNQKLLTKRFNGVIWCNPNYQHRFLGVKTSLKDY